VTTNDDVRPRMPTAHFTDARSRITVACRSGRTIGTEHARRRRSYRKKKTKRERRRAHTHTHSYTRRVRICRLTRKKTTITTGTRATDERLRAVYVRGEYDGRASERERRDETRRANARASVFTYGRSADDYKRDCNASLTATERVRGACAPLRRTRVVIPTRFIGSAADAAAAAVAVDR